MADTGAPWNIPYVEPTDNPRVFPAADEAQALAIAAGLSEAQIAGIGTNIVQTVKTDTFTTTSTTFANITGLSVDITPTSATSKVLLILHLGQVDGDATDRIVGGDVTRGGTPIGIGAADGSRRQGGWAVGVPSGTNRPQMASWSFLDSPGVATSVTYQARAQINAGTAYFNRSQVDGNSTSFIRTIMAITAIEVKA
jgi:hypothetical protein